MARPKKIQEDIIPHIEAYWINICDKDPRKLKYALIAEYLNKQGLELKDYDIRRNKDVAERIEQLKQDCLIMSRSGDDIGGDVVVFQSLNVNDFLDKHKNIYKLRKALAERDAYYADICAEAVSGLRQKEALLKELKKVKQKNQVFEQMATQMQATEEKLIAENKQLKTKCNSLLHIVKTHVYPEIANELLRESKLLEGGETVISDSGRKEIINDQDSVLAHIRKKNSASPSANILTSLFDKI